MPDGAARAGDGPRHPQDTVDFQPNYDGRTQEPTVLPARFPNLLVNGSAGIAVGMATNIPPHNLREVAEGAQWALEHPDATREELQAALLERIKGPDFPNGRDDPGPRRASRRRQRASWVGFGGFVLLVASTPKAAARLTQPARDELSRLLHIDGR